VKVKKEVLAQSWTTHGSNEFLHFENINIPNVSFRTILFFISYNSQGCNLFFKKKDNLIFCSGKFEINEGT
jgi:hypothetical protein